MRHAQSKIRYHNQEYIIIRKSLSQILLRPRLKVHRARYELPTFLRRCMVPHIIEPLHHPSHFGHDPPKQYPSNKVESRIGI